MKKSPPLVVLSGASGSGKTTLGRMLADRLSFYYGISHTTRPQRTGEKHGLDYYFIDKKEFKRMVEADDFFEWAEVYGNFYGTSKKMVEGHLTKGQPVVLDVDTQGAMAIKKNHANTLLIFIETPSEEELKTRLMKRATESEEALLKRLACAKQERALKNQYDHVVINHDLEQAFADIKKILSPHLSLNP